MRGIESTLGHVLEVWRGLRSSHGLLVTSVITLAAAIGMNVAMAALVSRALLTPARHIVHPESLATLSFQRDSDAGRVMRTQTTSWPAFVRLRDGVESFAGAAAFQPGPSGVMVGDEQIPAETMLVSREYFDVLGARPRIGAGLQGERDEAVALISHRFWTAAFGGDPSVLGSRVSLNGKPFAVAGVMRPGFSGHAPVTVDAWFPIEVALADSPGWDNPFRNVVSVVVRVRRGRESVAAAHVSGVLERRVELTAVEGGASTPHERRIAWSLAAVSAVVLLIGLANAGTLLLVRAARRRPEMAIRSALGASRWRLAAALAGESIAIGLVAAATAIVLGAWLEDIVRRTLLPSIVPAEGLDSRASATAAVAGVVAAAAAFVASAVYLPARAGSVLVPQRVGPLTRAQRSLLVFQTAVCVMLLSGAGMIGRSLHAMMNQDFGMDVRDVLVLDFEQGSSAVTDQDEIFRKALKNVRALPGVLSATVYQSMPFGHFHVPPIAVPGRPDPPSVGEQLPFLIAATPELFDVLGIRIVEGRAFTPADDAGAPVVVVNQTMAREIWPGETAIGKCIRIGFDPDFDPFGAADPPMPSAAVACREVVGVAHDVRQRSVVPAGNEAGLMQYYVPFSQVPRPPVAVGPGPHVNGLLVRTATDSAAFVSSIRRIVVGGRRDLPFVRVAPFVERLERQLRPWQMGTTLLVIFGALATGIASVGLYAAFAHAVASRRRELAVRLALGASGRNVRWLVLRDACVLTAIGAVSGAAASVIGGRSLQSLLFGIVPADPVVLGAAAALMLLIALAASIVPAETAARSDPARLLRAE